MSEQTMRGRLIKALKCLDARPVENRVGAPGTPDCNYADGWIELKWLKRWPENADECPVLLDHFTPQQRRWIRRRARVGGYVWLLLQVGQEWLLYDGEWAAEYVGRVNREILREGARGRWERGLKPMELAELLRPGGVSSES